MKERCFVFGALPMDSIPEYPNEGDLVVAADRGYNVARSLGIKPGLLVGDFDSLGEIPQHDHVIRLKVRKDDTDLEHAVKVAMEYGYTDFIVYGAAGGMPDHTIGNIAVAEMIADKGCKSLFYGPASGFTVIRDGAFRLPVRAEGRVGVFSLREISHGVTIRGLSYEAEDIDLPRATTRGVGNVFIGKKAEVSVRDGTLLIVWEIRTETENEK